MLKKFPLIPNILWPTTHVIYGDEKNTRFLIMALVIRYYVMLEIRALNVGDIYEETFFGPHVCLPCVDGSRRFFWPHLK